MFFPVFSTVPVLDLRHHIACLLAVASPVHLFVGPTWSVLDHSGTITDRFLPGTTTPCVFLIPGSEVQVRRSPALDNVPFPVVQLTASPLVLEDASATLPLSGSLLATSPLVSAQAPVPVVLSGPVGEVSFRPGFPLAVSGIPSVNFLLSTPDCPDSGFSLDASRSTLLPPGVFLPLEDFGSSSCVVPPSSDSGALFSVFHSQIPVCSISSSVSVAPPEFSSHLENLVVDKPQMVDAVPPPSDSASDVPDLHADDSSFWGQPLSSPIKWGLPNPPPAVDEGREWSATLQRSALPAAYCNLPRSSRSPPPKLPIDDWFAPNDDGQLPFKYLQIEFPSSRRRPGEREELIDDVSRRRTGEREELIDDVSVFVSAGHEETIDVDNGVRFQREEIIATGNGEHRENGEHRSVAEHLQSNTDEQIVESADNGEHFLKCGEQSSVIIERLDTGSRFFLHLPLLWMKVYFPQVSN